MFSQGREIQLVELYGWLRAVNPDDKCGDGADLHYYLELDTEWAIAQGIDINSILRVGNISGDLLVNIFPGFSPRRAVGLPLLKIELDSWGRGEEMKFPPSGPTPPADWQETGICPKAKIWPFDPLQPGLTKLEEFNFDINKRGPYVRMAGSLVTDSPHDFGPCEIELFWMPDVKIAIERLRCPLGASFSKDFAITESHTIEWKGSAGDWSPGLDTGDPTHFARWTEVHPPDLRGYRSQ
jgi:hypothetical protein